MISIISFYVHSAIERLLIFVTDAQNYETVPTNIIQHRNWENQYLLEDYSIVLVILLPVILRYIHMYWIVFQVSTETRCNRNEISSSFFKKAYSPCYFSMALFPDKCTMSNGFKKNFQNLFESRKKLDHVQSTTRLIRIEGFSTKHLHQMSNRCAVSN